MNGGTKRSLNDRKLPNESVDELSVDFFPPKRQAKGGDDSPSDAYGDVVVAQALDGRKKPLPNGTASATTTTSTSSALGSKTSSLPCTESPRSAAPTSKTRKRPAVSITAETIIADPVHVKAAFRYPSHSYSSDEAAGTPYLRLTTSEEAPNTLVLADGSRAWRESLSWVRIELGKTHQLLYSLDSPVMHFEFPQGEGLGSLMGVRFSSLEDARRVVAWVMESTWSKTINFKERPV